MNKRCVKVNMFFENRSSSKWFYFMHNLFSLLVLETQKQLVIYKLGLALGFI